MLLVRLMLLLESEIKTDLRRRSTQSTKEYRVVREGGGKGGKPIERCVISSFEVAKSPGLTSEVSPTERLHLETIRTPRVGESPRETRQRQPVSAVWQAPKVVLVMRGLQIT